MHGSPLIRTLGVLLVLLTAGLPMWRITHGAAAVVVVVTPAATAAATSQVHLAVGFAQKPLRFEVDYLGKAIWQEEAVSDLTASKDIAMNYPKEGVDLEYKVTWPPGTPLCAARLSVAANDAEPTERTLWGTGAVDDVLTYP